MKSKLNINKCSGFTLVEILTVIILLSVIALVVTPIIVRNLNDSKKQLYQTQLDNIESAARTYMVKQTFDSDFTIIYLRDLKKAGLIDKNIKNPKTNELFSDCLQVKVTKSGVVYQYEVLEEIPSSC